MRAVRRFEVEIIMEKLLKIQMNSRFQGGSDTLKKRLDARYRLIYGEARLAYKQQIDPESPILTPEVLIVLIDQEGKPYRVTMKRPGSNFKLTFIKGETCMAQYDTPAGLMELNLLTQELDGSFTEDGVKLNLKYELQLGADSLGVTELSIRG